MPTHVRQLITDFLDQANPEVRSLETTLRAALRPLPSDDVNIALRQAFRQATLRREGPRRSQVIGVVSRLMAEQALARGELSRACTHFGLAIRELGSALEATDRGQLLLDLAWVYHCLGDYATSLDWCTDAQRALQKEPENAQEALAHSMRGINFYRMGKLEDALWEHTESLSRRIALKDRAGEASSLNNLGNVYFERGEWDEAERCYRDSLRIYRELGRLDREAALENNLGNLASYRGDFDVAEDHHARALALRCQLGDRFTSGASRCALANTWLRAGRIAESVEGFRRGLRLLEVSGAVELKAEGLVGIAQALHVAGEIQDARHHLALGIEEARRTRNSLQLGAAHTTLSRFERLEGHADKASRALKIAYKYLNACGSRIELAKAQLEEAHVAVMRRDRDEARALLAQAIATFEQLGARPELVEAQALEARLAPRGLRTEEHPTGGGR